MLKKKIEPRDLADIIQREVGWFNGWAITTKQERESCLKAARKILKILKPYEKRD